MPSAQIEPRAFANRTVIVSGRCPREEISAIAVPTMIVVPPPQSMALRDAGCSRREPSIISAQIYELTAPMKNRVRISRKSNMAWPVWARAPMPAAFRATDEPLWPTDDSDRPQPGRDEGSDGDEMALEARAPGQRFHVVIGDDTIAARVLCEIGAPIGHAKQFLQSSAVAGVGRYPDRCRDPDPVFAVDHGCGPNPFADRFGQAPGGLGV